MLKINFLNLTILMVLPTISIYLYLVLRDYSKIKSIIYGLSINLFIQSFLVMTLSLLNIFSKNVYLSTNAVFILFLGFYIFNQRKKLNHTFTRKEVTICLFGFLAFSISIFANKPTGDIYHDYGLDETNYIAQAAYQSNHSNLFFFDNQRLLYNDYFPSAKWSSNSLEYRQHKNGAMTFNFPPLFKCLMTTFYMVGDLKMTFYINHVLAFLSASILIFLFSFFTNSIFAILITSSLFVFSPLIIQYARITMSEIYMFFVYFAGISLFFENENKNSLLLSIISGAFIASVLGIKADGLLCYFFSAIILFYYSIIKTDEFKSKNLLPLSISFLITSIYFWLITMYTTKFYMDESFSESIDNLSTYLICLMPIIYFFLRYVSSKSDILNKIWLKTKLVLMPIGFMIFIAACLMIFVRNHSIYDIFVRSFGENLTIQRFFFPTDILYRYFGLPFIFTGLLGFYLMFFVPIEDNLQKYKKIYFILVPFLLIAFASLLSPMHSLYHYWASRRYMGGVFPILLLGSLYFIDYCLLKIEKHQLQFKFAVSSLLLSSLLILNIVIQNKAPEYRGDIKKLEKFVQEFTSDTQTVIIDKEYPIARGKQIALKYYYNKEALVLDLNSITDAQILKFINNRKADNSKKIVFLTENPIFRERIQKIYKTEICMSDRSGLIL